MKPTLTQGWSGIGDALPGANVWWLQFPWPLENNDIHRWPAPRWYDSAVGADGQIDGGLLSKHGIEKFTDRLRTAGKPLKVIITPADADHRRRVINSHNADFIEPTACLKQVKV